MSSTSPPSSTTTASAAAAAAPPPSSSSSSSSAPHVRLMCSYGGRILPRPGDHLLRYVGGETRMVSLPKSASFSSLLSLLHSLSLSLSPSSKSHSPAPQIVVKYQLPHEDLDSLISLSSDDDLVNMLEELERLNPSSKSPRLRLFLFPFPSNNNSGAFGSVLSTGESNQWFVDALNSASPLERRRSEAESSMLSDQPDYLTGLDTGSDRSPVNQDVERAEATEPAEPVQAAQAQEVQTVPQPAQPVYYMPQPVPVYYMPAPVPYMHPSLDGRGSLPMHGFMPVPYDQFIQMGNTTPTAGNYMYEQPPAGGYVRAPLAYPPSAVYPPPPAQHQQVLADPGLKPPPAVTGSDLKAGRNS